MQVTTSSFVVGDKPEARRPIADCVYASVAQLPSYQTRYEPRGIGAARHGLGTRRVDLIRAVFHTARTDPRHLPHASRERA